MVWGYFDFIIMLVSMYERNCLIWYLDLTIPYHWKLCVNNVKLQWKWQHIYHHVEASQHKCHFVDGIFWFIFLNENFRILIYISVKFGPNDLINNDSALVQIMRWHRTSVKPLSQSMMASFTDPYASATTTLIWSFWQPCCTPNIGTSYLRLRNLCKLIEAGAKWPTFCRPHLQMHFRDGKTAPVTTSQH